MEKVLHPFWAKLENLTKFTFHASGRRECHGKGTLLIKKISDITLITEEIGSWEDLEGNTTNFKGGFRWSLKKKSVSLEHVRLGVNHPVFLFDLTPSGENTLISLKPHLCGKDSYKGEVLFGLEGVHLTWHIKGPSKNEKIDYHYS